MPMFLLRHRLDAAECATTNAAGKGLDCDPPPPPRIEPESSPSRPRHGRSQRALDLACAVFATHIVIDSYVTLRPGTSPGDHLVSGTVPVLVLAALAVFTRRLSAGGFGVTAALLGLSVAVGAAGAPVSGLLAGRVDPTTLSGLVALGAGITLIAVGAARLWTSRRTDGSRWRRYTRRSARAILGLVLGLMIAFPLGMGYVVSNRSSNPHADTDLGAPHVNITFDTADGLTLTGSYIPSRNGAAVIVFPGRRSQHTRMLADAGYGVLVFEPRGQASSQGDPNLLGWSGEADLDAAIAWLRTRPDVDPDRIGGLGLSVGGELMIQTAAHNPDLRAVVADGAGSRQVADDIHMPAPDNIIGLPVSALATLSTAVFSDSLPPPPLTELIDDIAPRPILLIWTSRGIGGEFNNPLYHDHAREPKTIWEIPEASHTHGIEARPDEYRDRVVAFFEEALG
jgi:hypothetical protein